MRLPVFREKYCANAPRMNSFGEERALVFGSPWDGKHHLSRNASAPLKGIARIKRSEDNHIERLSRAVAFPVFYRHAFRTEDRERMQKILSVEQRILRSVPFYSLACNMEPEAARLAYETMKNGGQTCI